MGRAQSHPRRHQRLGATTHQGRPEAGRAARANRRSHARHLSAHRRTPRDPPGRPRPRGPDPVRADLRNDRQPEGRTHPPAGSPQDSSLRPTSRPARVRAQGCSGPPGEDPLHPPGHAPVLHSHRDTAHDEQHSQAASRRNGAGRGAQCDSASVPSNRSNSNQRDRRPAACVRTPRHSDPSITREHYIRRNETVNPITADFLEQAFGRAG